MLLEAEKELLHGLCFVLVCTGGEVICDDLGEEPFFASHEPNASSEATIGAGRVDADRTDAAAILALNNDVVLPVFTGWDAMDAQLFGGGFSLRVSMVNGALRSASFFPCKDKDATDEAKPSPSSPRVE